MGVLRYALGCIVGTHTGLDRVDTVDRAVPCNREHVLLSLRVILNPPQPDLNVLTGLLDTLNDLRGLVE